MAEGGFDEDVVFREGDTFELEPLIPRRESLAYELERAETSLSKHRLELLKDKVESFYRSTGITPDFIDYNNFHTDDDGYLFYKKVRLTYRNDPSKFLSLHTLRSKFNSVTDMRRQLSVSEYNPKLSSKAISTLHETQRKLPVNVEEIPMQELPQAATETINELETDPPLPMREIIALNESLQSIRGELVNNLAKLSELDKHIEYEKQKLADMDDDPRLPREIKERTEKRLKDLQIERDARLEVLSTNRKELSSQISRIRETIRTILNEDTTLVERLKTLFREQGITIASVLTAIGMSISTIVLALTGGAASPTSSPPPSDSGSVREWVKKQLQHLSDLLKKLGMKAIDALPGIIGSIVSWLLSTLGKVVGYMGEHLWTVVLLGIGLFLSEIKKK